MRLIRSFSKHTTKLKPKKPNIDVNFKNKGSNGVSIVVHIFHI